MPRFEALVGAPLAELDRERLQGLVDGGVREDADLDFKSDLYGTSDSERRELAGDVAAMASSGGGVILLGVAETEGVATGLTPVAISDAEHLRMHQIVASWVAPHPRFEIITVPDDSSGTGWYAIVIEASRLAPHAVVVNTGLRYPRRNGSSTRWLSESEVADAYRNRFVLAREQVERVTSVRTEGEAALPSSDHAWVTVAVVPDVAGDMPISGAQIASLRSFPRNIDWPHIARGTDGAPHVAAGHRRLTVNLSQDEQGRPRDGLLHLHQDGSAFVAMAVGREPRAHDGTPQGYLLVNDEWLTQNVIAAIAIAAFHARANARTSGDAIVESSLVADIPMALGHSRDSFSNTWNDIRVQEAPVGRHTISLDEVASTMPGLMIAARLAVTDLLQGFGIPESPQITEEGAIRWPYIASSNRQFAEREAERCGIEIVQTALPA